MKSICITYDHFTYLGGGYVISPISQGKQSVVKHMLAIDWKFWRSYIFTSSAKYITIRMLGRVAGNALLLGRLSSISDREMLPELKHFVEYYGH